MMLGHPKTADLFEADRSVGENGLFVRNPGPGYIGYMLPAATTQFLGKHGKHREKLVQKGAAENAE